MRPHNMEACHLLVDRHQLSYGGNFVASLSTRRGGVSADDALPHCRLSSTVRPPCRGERRLLRPPPDYTMGELLLPPIHGSI